eukprot:TRINITY_DN7175_c0_g1_i2.p1 TRINITY_DN7175_c0_g1~~TRINITY_DN7175_c0_g1_i2.p1  ORF type:complete len:145 (+),score=13.20 TRINITY_DN7175_c0_g1_i2:131-565(+)
MMQTKPTAHALAVRAAATTAAKVQRETVRAGAHRKRRGEEAPAPAAKRQRRGAEKSVRVVCRVRPATDGRALADVAQVMREEEKTDEFVDTVLGPESTQAEVFEEISPPLIQSCVEGFHASVFALGHGDSGKTYTMEGPSSRRS